jgi:hypothetical protein
MIHPNIMYFNRLHSTCNIPLRAATLLGLTMIWGSAQGALAQAATNAAAYPKIVILDPPEQGFFSKSLDFHGIKIKAAQVVVDEALYAAYDRLSMQTAHLPMVITNLAAAGAELHIIGRDQVTTDLPEWRQDKHVPLDEYNGLDRDRRTRGMGGLITSCGEENLLNLPTDRYRGSDICLHEFAHNIQGAGMTREVRARFDEQARKSKDKGLWLDSYAGSNSSEYFAELTMWYFGTHGSMTMTGPKPENGPEGLKKYDPDAYALFDDFYSGRIEIAKTEPRFRRTPPGGTNTFIRQPRDSLQARAIVAKLTSYKIGETKLADFYADAGVAGPGETSNTGWRVIQRESAASGTNAVPSAEGALRLRVLYHDTRTRDAGGTGAGSTSLTNQNATTTSFQTTNAVAAQGTNAVAGPGRRGGGGRGGGGGIRGEPSLADLDFNGGVLTAFKWNN